MKHLTYILTIAVLIFMQSCASQKPATGGPKDTTIPSVEQEQPSNKSTYFNSNSFTITFDERVRANNINKNMIITPATTNIEPKTSFDKNKLTVSWKGNLQVNTTYTFYLNNCVKDITQGNKIDKLVYTFSTGSVLDSNIVEGQAINELENTPISKALVGLYLPSDSLDITKDKPDYYTYTNTEGNFLLENLPSKVFNVFLIQDENSNLKYESNEHLSFLNETITTDSNLAPLHLSVFKDDNIKPDIGNYSDQKNILKLKFKDLISSYEILDSSLNKLTLNSFYDSINKTLVIYYDSSSVLNIVSTDFSNNIDTSLYKVSIDMDTALVNTIKVTNKATTYKENDTIVITTDHLLSKLDSDSIKIVSDTTNILDFKTYISNNQVFIYNIGNVDNKLLITVKPSCIFSINPLVTNNMSNYLLIPYNTEDFGSLHGEVTGANQHKIWIELLNRNEDVIKTTSISPFTFLDLKPGSYKIRVKLDQNNNGKWDIGDFKTKQLPEKIVFHNTPFDVRSNWKIEDINIPLY